MVTVFLCPFHCQFFPDVWTKFLKCKKHLHFRYFVNLSERVSVLLFLLSGSQHPLGQDSLNLIRQFFGIHLFFPALLQQHPCKSSGPEIQQKVHIRIIHRQPGRRRLQQTLKIFSSGGKKHPLNLLSALRVQHLFQQFPVLYGEFHKDLQSLFRLLVHQRLLQHVVQRLVHSPLDDIHQILEMVIKSLAGNMTGFHQGFYRYVIHSLFTYHPGKRPGNHLFHFHGHGAHLLCSSFCRGS